MSDDDRLPSWREGEARSAILALLDSAAEIEPDRRVAVFDNDGTLWCERPDYIQLDFFVAELRAGAARAPELAERPEYRAVLDGDRAALADLGIERVAVALVELFDGMAPEAFDDRVRRFFATAAHPSGRPFRHMTYAPMIELLDEVRAAGILPFIVSGGGNEFVRAVCRELYGVPPWHVVGTSIAYRVDDEHGTPVLRRTAEIVGGANEGDQKVSNIRLHLGVRPVLAVGNSAGDARMLDHTAGTDGAGLAVLIDHDDADREYAYASEAGTFDAEPILDTAARRGWTVVSMQNDWTRVFADR